MFLLKKKNIGTTLLEVCISTVAFTVVLMTLFAVAKVGTDAWEHDKSKNAMQTMLRKMETYLLDDIRRTKSEEIHATRIGDCQALWFRSAVGSDEVGKPPVFSRTMSGMPLYKRTILYYSTPIQGCDIEGDGSWHYKRYGIKCDRKNCPHKMLIRKEIVFPGDNDNKFVEAKVMSDTDITHYLTEPDADYNYKFAGEIDNSKLNTAGCKSVQVLADGILLWRVRTPDKSITNPSDKNATLRAAGVDISIGILLFEEARKHLSVGQAGDNKYINETDGYSDKNKSFTFEKAKGMERFITQYDMHVVPSN